MPDSVKLVIFDLDGTLINAYKAVSASLNYAFKELGYPEVDDYTIQRSVGWGERNLLKAFVPEEDIDKVLSIFRVKNKEALKSSCKFMPGAKELLETLNHKGYKLAIATNRPSYSSHIILKNLDILKYFDFVLCGDELKNLKPDGEILQRVLDKFSLTPYEAVYVGDMTVDAQTGINAGVKTIVVITGSSTEEEVAQLRPYKIIHNVFDVEGIIEEM